MYLSPKDSDEKLNITYFVIEPGSFLEPEVVDGTRLGDSDVSNPIVLDESFLYGGLRSEMRFSLRRRSLSILL